MKVGYAASSTVPTNEAINESQPQSCKFDAPIAPHSSLEATCFVRMATYRLYWDAKVRITYSHGAAEVRTIHGQLEGKAVSEVFAQYDKP